MEATNFFGLTEEAYNVLLSASRKKKYKPSQALIERTMAKYPRISEKTADTALRLINSPVRDTFTLFDVVTYLKSI